MAWYRFVLIAVVCYFLGNVSWGLLIGQWMAHMDIRKHGSGGTGTTNVMRTLGWVPSLLTLIGDVLKAYLAVVIGRALGGDWGWKVGGIAVLLGHNWPVIYGFKGGKGMACSLGIILATDPPIAITALVLQVVILLCTRYMSVASICNAILYPVLVAIFRGGDVPYLVFSILACLLALFCHRGNIDRLLHGTEHRLDFSKIKSFSKYIHLPGKKK